MKCPLLTLGHNACLLNEVSTGVNCLKEECAWWDIDDERCLFQTVLFELNRIGSALQLIEQKMPHVDQFTK